MPLELRIDTASESEWRALLRRAPRSGLQQDWVYGCAVQRAGNRVLRAVALHRGEPVALAQLVERRIGALARIAMLIRGPVWVVPELRDLLEPAFLAQLRAVLGRAVLLWSPERPEVGDRLWGLRRVMTGYSTVWIDLGHDAATLRSRLHGKWRNRLHRAEAEPIEVRRVRRGGLVDWLLDASERRRVEVGYRGPTPAFVRGLAACEDGDAPQLGLVALERREPVAGILLQRHGACATYLVAATTPRGRVLRANHLLLWRALLLLKEEGVAALDLGGIDTVRAPGLARFKLGLGGAVATLAGTFLAKPVGRAGRSG